MKDFFSFVGKGYEGEITLDPIERIIPMVLSILIILLLIVFGKKINKWKHEQLFRKSIGILLFLVWSSYFIWYILHGKFGSQSLPVSLCSLTSIGFIIVLLTNNRKLLDIMFYWGIIGGLLAMLFVSDVYRGVDHYRYYEFYLDHMIIFLAPFYYLFVNQYEPTIKTTIISFISLFVTSLLVLPINLIYKMDYMIMNPYTAPVGTPADLIATLVNRNIFGYISILVIIGSIVYVVLYLFILLLKKNTKRFSI